MSNPKPKLTLAVREALALLAKGPQPRQKFNPGVNASMEKQGLVNTQGLPSPFANSKGRLIEHQVINKNGLAALNQRTNDE